MPTSRNRIGSRLLLLFLGLCVVAMFGTSVVYRAKNPNLTVQSKKKSNQMPSMGSGMGASMGAIQEMMAKAESDPENVENLMDLGNAFLMMRAWDRALVFVERARALQPDNVGILKSVGICYFQKQMHDQAVEVYEQILTRVPDDALSHYNLGIIFKHYLNNPASAKVHFNSVLTLTNDAEMKRHAKKELDELGES